MIREFLVQGSQPDPYKVVITRNGPNLNAYCSCPAGKNGQVCKHRIAILNGSAANVVSDNVADVAEVASWLAGTDVAAVIAELTTLEVDRQRIDEQIKRAKKKLASVMRS